ncbi:hypothetical protein chiPu_0031949, partial [Chiloscyllium punctatum]|nr:hypothetical protein [Chiloscyllium punctatum]
MRVNRNEYGLDQPAPRDLAVTPEYESSVTCLDVFAMLPPHPGHLPPLECRKSMVDGVEVVPQKQHAENPIRLDDRGSLLGPLTPPMLDKAAHHAEHQAGINKHRQILQNAHAEGFDHQQHEHDADQ